MHENILTVLISTGGVGQSRQRPISPDLVNFRLALSVSARERHDFSGTMMLGDIDLWRQAFDNEPKSRSGGESIDYPVLLL